MLRLTVFLPILLAGGGKDTEALVDRREDPVYRKELGALHARQVDAATRLREVQRQLAGRTRPEETPETAEAVKRFDNLKAEEARLADEIETARREARQRVLARRELEEKK